MDDYRKEQAKNGRKGGRVTLEKHGRNYFAKLGKKGAKKRWSKLKVSK